MVYHQVGAALRAHQFDDAISRNEKGIETKIRLVEGSDLFHVFDVQQDATNFCALLTARDLQAGIIPPNYTYRLPTEAEWEYAARGGTTTLYSFGNSPAQLGTHGWYADNSAETTHPVGQKLPNPWGLYDAHGNVWEWCSDWAGNYPGGSVTDPQGPASGTAKIIRGGSWFQTGTACRSANRDTNVAGSRNGDVGFRVVLAPVP